MIERKPIYVLDIPLGYTVSYKELCGLLQITYIEDTRKRKRQLEALRQCVDYEKVGSKYKINKITGSSFIINDGRSRGNNSTYNRYAPEILLNHLLYCRDGSVEDGVKSLYISETEIKRELGLCNKDYGFDGHAEEMIRTGVVTRLDLQLFYKSHGTKSKEVMKSTLNQIKARMPDLCYVPTYLVGDNETGRRVTTPEEYIDINALKPIVLEEMGIEKEFLVYLKGRGTDFREKWKKLIQDQLGLKCISKGYQIHLPDYMGSGNQDFFLDADDVKHKQKSANALLMDYLKKEVEKELNKAKANRTLVTAKNEDLNGDLTETDAFSKSMNELIKVPVDHVKKQSILHENFVKVS